MVPGVWPRYPGDRKTDRQINKQTDRQTDRQTEAITFAVSHSVIALLKVPIDAAKNPIKKATNFKELVRYL